MRGPLVTFALWLGATAVAVGIGLSATRLVASSVTGPPADVAADLVQDRVEAPPSVEAPSPGASPTPAGSPSPSPAPSAEPPAETRTVSVAGGDAALRFSAGRVEVLWATPNAGFVADVDDDPDDAEARVEFRAPDHRSRIRAAWEDGEPRVEIEERPDG